MKKINWNEYFKVSIDLYAKDTSEIEDRLKTCGFEFTKNIINANNNRTNFEIETTPAQMGKVIEILNN